MILSMSVIYLVERVNVCVRVCEAAARLCVCNEVVHGACAIGCENV